MDNKSFKAAPSLINIMHFPLPTFTFLVCLMGHLFQPSAQSEGVALMPNVLKVFLENGQTKSFKYDSSTTVQVKILSRN